jgi:[acyl-carrier-protein] S-malonyltransferase
MKFAALFPGQGSQSVGMIKVLRDEFPYTREIFEEANDALREDLAKLCLEGPEASLQLTHNAQPALLMTSYAWFRVLKRTLDFRPAAGAGHSLGEYSALCAAGAMTLTEAVKLVRKRGELMQTAVPQGKGKMAAVIGLDDDKVKELCAKATEGPHSLVVPANFNAPSQVVIAGHARSSL